MSNCSEVDEPVNLDRVGFADHSTGFPDAAEQARRARRRRVWSLLVGAALIVLHALTVTRPHVSRYHGAWFFSPMPDDAYYYFKPAWNLLHGDGLTLDGFSATNGFHPLWMMMVVAVAAVSATKESLLEHCMWLSVASFYASAVLLTLLVKAIFSSRSTSLLALGLYLAIPYVFAQHMNGLETGLVLLLTSASLCVLVSVYSAHRAPRLPSVVALGVLSGLLFLARTDMVFAVCAAWLLSAAPFLSRARSRAGVGCRRVGGLLRHLCALAVPFVVVVSPWFVWSLSRFGAVVQASAYVLPCVERAQCAAYHGCASVGWHHAHTSVLWSRFSDTMQELTTGLPVLVWAIVVGVSAYLATRGRGRLRAQFVAAFAVLLASFLLLACVHVLLRFSPRPWYFVHAQLLLVLALAAAFYVAVGRRKSWLRGLAVAVLMVAVVVHVNRRFSSLGFPSRAVTPAAAVQRVGAMYRRLPGGVRVVGHTDAGRFAYFAPDSLTVVNLDGLINNAAAAALCEGRLAAYVLMSPVEYVIMRPQLGNLESVMGRGYRRHFDWVGRVGSYLCAYPIRDSDHVFRHLRLPPDGDVRPSCPDQWHHLVGEWQLPSQQQDSVAICVKNCGIQFSIDTGDRYRFSVVMCSLGVASGGTCDVMLDGDHIGTLSFDDSLTARRVIGERRLSRGIHELVLADCEGLAPQPVGSKAGRRIRGYVIESFRVSPMLSRS